ncbi:MAG TPA: hypothetical protein VHU79_06490 [Sphingomicrobium sp.]|nr:hypothetical protein [Sphingomicrobium sp.]
MAGQNSERPVIKDEHLSFSDSASPNELDDQLKSLNEQAERCRRLAGSIYDRDVAKMLGNMAEGYERTAKELSQRRFG